MKNRWTVSVGIILVIFAYLVGKKQFFDVNYADQEATAPPQYFILQCVLKPLTNIWEVEWKVLPLTGVSRKLDLILPPDAHVFVSDMTGKTNANNAGYYYFLTYYLFPRAIAVSVDQPARITKDGFIGHLPRSDAELESNGFDVVVAPVTNRTGVNLNLRLLHDYPLQNPSNPDWFFSRSDVVMAFLFPLLTALAGMWLLRLVLPPFSERIPMLEKLAYSFGLGMMAVGALTLGVKLCGFSGRGLVLMVTGISAVIGFWRNYQTMMSGLAGGLREMLSNPFALVVGFVFLLIFRLAALRGLIEYDAVAGWALKAKIFHLYTGSEIVRWFSNPRLAHAHLDYPTLVPSLYAATYDTLGRVNEYVIKFWPAWMLLLMIGALASLNRNRERNRVHGPSFLLPTLVLLPVVWKYTQLEGGTMPMVFFTVLGFLQCAIWQVERARDRLALGLILLFGAAMAKFEGFIILTVTVAWMLMLPSARPSLKPSPLLWRILGFCFLSVLPFACLRVQIPALHYESGWADYALHHPGFVFSEAPAIFVILLSRWFMDPSFANWSGMDGRLHWDGKWEGLASLYNHPTFGLAWICLLMTLALWFAVPARRRIVVWMLASILTIMASFSVVFASIGSVTSLGEMINYTSESTSGRYLLPLLLAWATTTMTLLFEKQPSLATSLPGSERKGIAGVSQ